MIYLGVSLGEWRETAAAAHDVVDRRLAVLARCDREAAVELHRALLEKVAFLVRWSCLLAAGGWLDLDAYMACMAAEIRAEIAGNRDRLGMPR